MMNSLPIYYNIAILKKQEENNYFNQGTGFSSHKDFFSDVIGCLFLAYEMYV
jgi:hypothetical protein